MPDNEKKQKKNQKKRQAPLMPRTKGYYRFTKDYPGETDEYGYRDNETIRKKPLPNRGRLAVYFAIIFCFILGFVATSVALQISNLEPETTTRAETVTEEPQSEDLPPPDFTTEPETETEGFTVPQTHTQPETGTAQETTAGPRDTQETTEPGGDA